MKLVSPFEGDQNNNDWFLQESQTGFKLKKIYYDSNPNDFMHT